MRDSLRDHFLLVPKEPFGDALDPKNYYSQPVETRCETYLGHLNGTAAHQDIAPSEKKIEMELVFMNAGFQTLENSPQKRIRVEQKRFENRVESLNLRHKFEHLCPMHF